MSGYIGVEPVAQALRVRSFGTLTFSSDTITVAGGFSPGNIEVYINGAAVQPTDYDDSDGLGVVFIQQLSAGTEYVIMEARSFLVADTWSKSEAYSKAQADGKFSGKGYFYARDEKAVGTDGGSSVGGVQTRTLNTVANNTLSGASLSTNQITLPAGTYRVVAKAQAFRTLRTKIYLYNVTDSTLELSGISSYSDTSEGVAIMPSLSGVFTIAGAKVFELRHYTAAARADVGLGVGTNFSASGLECYAEIEIFKVA